MSIRRTTAVLLALTGAALGACGSADRSGGGGATRATTGEAIFREAGCAGCHALGAAGAQGGAGPSLDERKPSAAAVEAKVRNGGGGMPAFGGQLSEAQIRAVSEYVARSAGRR